MKGRFISLGLPLACYLAGSMLSACALGGTASTYVGREGSRHSTAYNGWVSYQDVETINWDGRSQGWDAFWPREWWGKDGRWIKDASAHDRSFHFVHNDAFRTGRPFTDWNAFDDSKAWHWGDCHYGDLLSANVTNAAMTPEPASCLLFSSGLLALGLKLRRRRQA